jgi:hypothetical protein
MSIKQLSIADLQRQYHYAGFNDTQAILKNVFNLRFATVAHR